MSRLSGWRRSRRNRPQRERNGNARRMVPTLGWMFISLLLLWSVKGVSSSSSLSTVDNTRLGWSRWMHRVLPTNATRQLRVLEEEQDDNDNDKENEQQDGDEDNEEENDNDEEKEEEEKEEEEKEEEEEEQDNNQEEEQDNYQDQDNNQEDQDENSRDDNHHDDRNRRNYLDDDTAAVFIDDDIYYAFEEDDNSKPKLFPLKSNDAFAFLVASFGVTMAAGGGIGGGGVVVPSYILIMGFTPREAIPLTAVTVFGGALAGLVMNGRRRHPLADRPLIDWNLVLVMEPLVLVGTMVGALLHRVLSEKVLVVLLVALLSVTARLTLRKANRMYAAETSYIEKLKTKQREAQSSPHKALSTQLSSGEMTQSITSNLRQEILIQNPDFVSLRTEVIAQEKVAPASKVTALCCMFTVLISLNIMVGGGAFRSPFGIICGSVAFWVVHVIMLAFLVASAWVAQTYLKMRHEIKELVQYDYVHGDVKWDSRGAVVYPLVFSSAGTFAGMFGIGGGIVVVPMLLQMGVHPAVAVATSSCMTLFTSFAATTSFIIFGLLLWDYALVCVLLGFFAHMFGLMVMKQARNVGKLDGERFERNSLIGYSIGGVVLLSALLMTLQYVYEITTGDPAMDEDGGLCEGYRRSV